jgi:hypothetical protein
VRVAHRNGGINDDLEAPARTALDGLLFRQSFACLQPALMSNVSRRDL